MIHANNSRLLITKVPERLLIREIDPLWRLPRLLVSLPFICTGLLVLYVALGGGGMAPAIGWSSVLIKALFLGFLGLVLGIIPLASGLRLWLIREEIVIHSVGSLEKCFMLGSCRFCRISVGDLSPGNFSIRTWSSGKSGTHHEVVLQSSTEDVSLRLLSLKSKPDAAQWLKKISSLLETPANPAPVPDQPGLPVAPTHNWAEHP